MASTAINNRADTANAGGDGGNNSLQQQSVNVNRGVQEILPAVVVILFLLLMLTPTRHVSNKNGLFVPSSIRN
jgi:hypothetical protein